MKQNAKYETKSLTISEKINKLIKILSNNLLEKETAIAIALLGAVSGQNTFLLGPPGTGKSLISRRVSKAFKEQKYFECLMNRFTTPEDIFGPVSLAQLKNDNYQRLTDGYLPKAHFAFMDEIWKSSPAILNSLLTIINEGHFKNGTHHEVVPLESLIAASNETPMSDLGLDAIYDRFILRLMINPIERQENFDSLISSNSAKAELNIDDNLLITSEELNKWRKGINDVVISSECLEIIKLVRIDLLKENKNSNMYVSDRRWQRAVYIMKASAFCNDRKKTSHSDAFLLQHCLWNSEEERGNVTKIIESSIEQVGIHSDISISDLDKRKELLDTEIHKELYHNKNIYETVPLNGKEYFKVSAEFKGTGYGHDKKIRELYIPFNKMKKKEEFYPVDENENELDNIECTFDKQGTCKLIMRMGSYYKYNYSFTPEILFHKGDKKKDINERLSNSLREEVSDIKNESKKVLDTVLAKKETKKEELKSCFITEIEINFILNNIEKQIEKLNLRIKDCERLDALCK